MSFSFAIKLSYILIIPGLLFSCSPWSSETDRALELAGDHRAELEKVLRYYQKVDPNPLKLKAAEYLIANMIYQYSIFGPGIDSLNNSFEYVYGVYYKDRNPVFRSDSVKQRMRGKREAEYDLLRISSSHLIDQIESAFNTYNRFEWCRKYPFEMFCEYILPYKIGHSDPVNWRDYAHEKYSPILNHSSFKGTNSFYEAEQFAKTNTLKVRAEGASGKWAYHLQPEDSGPFEMDFDTRQPGFQLFNIHYLNGHSTAAKVRIMIDSLIIGDFIFPASGDWQIVDKDVPPIDFTVRLDSGKHQLKLMALDKNILVDYVYIPEYVNLKLPQSIISEGKYYLKNSVGRVTIAGDSLVNEGSLKVHPQPTKDWPLTIKAKDGNLYQLVFEQDSGLKKAVDAFPFGDSEWVLVYNDHGYQNQQWAFVPMDANGYQIRNKETGKILAYSEKDSTLIQLPAELMREEYIWHLESIVNQDEDVGAGSIDISVRAAQKISEITDRFHWSGSAVEIGPVNPTYLLDYPYGSCVEETNFQTMVLRSMGVACAVDFVFNYPERNAGHSWSVIFDLKGNTIQNNCHNPVGAGTWVDVFKKGKVYRKTNTINPNSLFMINNGEEPIPGQFQTPYFTDVTKEYCEVKDIKVDILPDSLPKNRFGYLMVFNNKDWIFTAWGERKANAVVFKDVEPGAMYLPAFYTYGDFEPMNDPFFIDSLGNVHHLTASKERVREITLKRKFPNRRVDESLHKLIIGGKFQGANKADFSDSVTIGTITNEILDPVFHTISVDTKKTFKYLRYLGPDGSHCNISEIIFFDAEGDTIAGEIIGTEGSLEHNGSTKEKVFDKDVLTYFDAPAASGSWVGLKLNKPTPISKIRFVARNDGNMVEIGDEYELVYWDKSWVSAGKQIATTDSLIFENVPANALYLLHNHTKGWEERIFTYKNGKQVWW